MKRYKVQKFHSNFFIPNKYRFYHLKNRDGFMKYMNLVLRPEVGKDVEIAKKTMLISVK